MTKQAGDIATAMKDVQNEDRAIRLDPVNDHIIVGWKAAQSGFQIVVAGPSEIRIAGQQPEALADLLNNLGSDIDAAASLAM